MSALGQRAHALERLARSSRDRPFDVLVVGGGITGAGIALDAAARGMSVATVERRDFASGTSSKSSKLVHGGLRYLEQREFGLVREASTERDLLGRLAPHLVEPIPFVIPVTSRSRRAMFGVGLWTYDALASFKNLSVHRHVDPQRASEMVPLLPAEKIRGAYLFYDSRTDDARLVMEVLIQAVRHGATVVNHAPVVDLRPATDVVTAKVTDVVSEETIEVHARRVVAAAGVWTDEVEWLAHDIDERRLRPSKGIHLVFRRSTLPVGDAAAFIPDVEGRRMLFVIPWIDDSVLVGTTDTAYEGDLDAPDVEAADLEYCLASLRRAFDVDLSNDDIAGAYAGLRPLIAGKAGATADLSRRHAIYDIADGIIGITGGKLTTYRRMAADVVDRIATELGLRQPCRTRWIRLGVSDVGRLVGLVERRARRIGIDQAVAANLVRGYGERSLDVLDLAVEEGLAAPAVEGHLTLEAEIAYAARAEMATNLSDALARRTRLALTDPCAGIGATASGAAVMASELGWSEAETERQVANHRAAIERERGIELAPVPRVRAYSSRTG